MLKEETALLQQISEDGASFKDVLSWAQCFAQKNSLLSHSMSPIGLHPVLC